MKIGMFDSGVGGLTVLKEFIEIMPNHEYIYFGDTKRVPYGGKSKESIISFSKEIIEFLISKKVDLIIIACNTASAVALEEIKNDYNIDIIGVINPAVEFVKNSNFEKIGLIGTKTTTDSNIYKKYLINKVIISKACPLLVPLIEENIKSEKIINTIINYYLNDFKNSNIDCLILGCTHYPILENKMKNYLKSIKIINPAVETAKYVKNKYKNLIETKNKITFYFSDINENIYELAERIMNDDITKYKIEEKSF